MRFATVVVGLLALAGVAAASDDKKSALAKSSVTLASAEEMNQLPIEQKKAKLHAVVQGLARKEKNHAELKAEHAHVLAKLQNEAKENVEHRKELHERIALLEKQIELAKTELKLSHAQDDDRRIRAQMSVVENAKLGSDGKQALFTTNWGGVKISDDQTVQGNKGWAWNFGDNFAEPNSKALANGWTSGADTVHSGGVGMFGRFGVAVEGCRPGTYSNDGWMPCTDCEAGKYNTLYSQEGCLDCASGYTSDDGATECYVDVPTKTCSTRETDDGEDTDACSENSVFVSGPTGGSLQFTQTENNERCNWEITPPAGKATRIAVTSINLETWCDYVKFNDLCFDGSVTHDGFTITTDSVAVHFSSDGSVIRNEASFSCDWEFVDMPSNLVEGTTVY